MSGDCGHGWGHHKGGASSICSKCKEEFDVKNKCKQLYAYINKLEKAIAIYVLEEECGMNFELDSDAINYFCEKYNE